MQGSRTGESWSVLPRGPKRNERRPVLLKRHSSEARGVCGCWEAVGSKDKGSSTAPGAEAHLCLAGTYCPGLWIEKSIAGMTVSDNT